MDKELARQIQSGLKLRCGHCGTGSLFKSYLKLKEQCDVCQQDLTIADTADGPAFFVGFGVTIILVPVILVLVLSFSSFAGKLVAFAIGLTFCLAICILLLPLAKAILLNLQIFYNSGEGSLDG
ncbi:MAG: hypothetical protein Pars2KO_08990 [Parasphingorhabdus sp.]